MTHIITNEFGKEIHLPFFWINLPNGKGQRIPLKIKSTD